MKYKKWVLILLLILIFNFYISFQKIIEINKDSRPLEKLASSSINPFYFEGEKTWGGSENDRGEGIAVDSSHNIYVVGQTSSYGDPRKICFIKFNNNSGEVEWYKLWNDGLDDIGYGITIDPSDNIYIVGTNAEDMILIKFDKFGNEIWNVTWGGLHSDYGRNVVVDNFNNVYVIGCTEGFGLQAEQDGVLIKYNSSGDLEWDIIWGDHNYDYGQDIEIDPLGNIFILGWYQKTIFPGDDDIYLAKYNTNGVQEWFRIIGSDSDDHGYGLILDLSGNIYICGRTYDSDINKGDVWLIKCNSSGIPLWNKTWGGDKMEIGYGIDIDLLGYIYVTGFTESYSESSYNMFLIKYNNDGEFQKEFVSSKNYEEGADLLIDGLDKIYVAGTTYIVNLEIINKKDICLFKFSLTDKNNVISGYNLLITIMILGLVLIIQVIILKKFKYKNL